MDEARAWLERASALAAGSVAYAKLGPEDEIAGRAIGFLESAQRELALEASPTSDEAMVVSVDDVKAISALVRLVAVFGVYRNVPDAHFVPLQPRLPAGWPLPNKHLEGDAKARTGELGSRAAALLKSGGDVSQVVLMSAHFVDILVLTLNSEKQFQGVTALIPTPYLYRLLVQLRSVTSPADRVSSLLNSMILVRDNAVFSMLQLLTESPSEDLDVTDVDKAVLIFSAIPQGIPAKAYIEAFGKQLFAILRSKVPTPTENKILHSTILLVRKLDDFQPKLLGRLRDLVVEPFKSPEGSFANSAGALLNLLRGITDRCSFIDNTLQQTAVSLWLLHCGIRAKSIVDPDVLYLLTQLLSYGPHAVANIVTSLLVQALPGNLQWTYDSCKAREAESGKPISDQYVSVHMPHLVESIAPLNKGESIMKLLAARLDILVEVLRQLDSSAITKALISLMKLYPSEVGESRDGSMRKLLLAKAIETLTQDEVIKRNLFEETEQIVEFAFSIISARRKTSALDVDRERLGVSESPRDIAGLSLSDSDDEDEGDTPETSVASEDDDIIELALSLLGTLLMETLADAKNDVVTSAQLESLRSLASDETVAKRVRARAQFCTELLTGATSSPVEADLSSDASILSVAEEALREPLVPSRAYGISLISKLVDRKGIASRKAFDIYIAELGDEDSFIYLNTIKAIQGLAKTYGTAEVIELLFPYLRSAQSTIAVDTTLRAREALIRLLTPGSVHNVSSRLVELFLGDLRASAKDTVDVRFRLSSASLIAIICAQFPSSIAHRLQYEIADCALGILRHERQDDVLHRSAVVLCLEVMNATNEGLFTNVGSGTLESIALEVCEYMEKTTDETLKDLCKATLEAAQ